MPKISLKAARVNAGLGQKQAAKMLGISNSTLSSWERGKSMPNVTQIEKICELYKVHYDNLNFFTSKSA